MNITMWAFHRWSLEALVGKRNVRFLHNVINGRLQIVILIQNEYPSIQAYSEMESIDDMSMKFIKVS